MIVVEQREKSSLSGISPKVGNVLKSLPIGVAHSSLENGLPSFFIDAWSSISISMLSPS